MLTRKSPFAQGENDRTIMQDGFSAPVESAPRQRFSSACAMVGRRVMDFSDNGDGTLTAVRCVDRQADDLDIQFEAGACPVVAIAPRAFEGCAALRRVILPESLRQIGEMAFSGCSHLRLLTIPGGVQRVGTLAFAKCSQLERVRIEPGVVQLGPSCFSKCAALKRVEMPASVTQIGGGAFFGCSKELRLYGAEDAPAAQYARLNGLTFDSQSWKDDSGTLEQLVVGGGVREIGESAFFGCRQLVSVSFERGLEQLKDSAFAGCESLTQVTLPWGTSAVGRMAFFGCTRLSFVKMPTTTRVSDFAFDGCAPGIRVFGGVYAGRMNPISE